uniref:Uncharacterized protein n=1 Tax=Coptotermes formosanus TaxID=36987 RepID=R4V2B2_COPFO|nr:hypothetical protein [Coptotermes formosanus]
MPEYVIYNEKIENDFGRATSNYKNRKGEIDFELRTDDIEGAQADSSTAWYRKFRQPSDEIEIGETINFPSMKQQEIEYLKQKKLDELRGQRLRIAENKLVAASEKTTDVVQGLLKMQRTKGQERGYNIISNI